MYELCLTYDYVSHTDESCHAYELVIYDIWMIRVLWMNQIVVHMNESCHTRCSFSSVFDFCSQGTFTYTHMDESYRTCECVMSHMWMCHVTHVNVSYRTCEWVMSHGCMRHVAHMKNVCHTYKWFSSLVWMSHVTNMNGSCHTYEWVGWHYLCVLSNSHTRALAHSLSHTLSHSHTLTLSHPHNHTLSHSHTPISHALTLICVWKWRWGKCGGYRIGVSERGGE